MKTLERGPRKKGKKLYRFKQILRINDPPIYLWRTGIDLEERRILGLAGFNIQYVPTEKWTSVLKE